MTEQAELLCGNYRPITGTIGFIESDAQKAAQAFFSWKDRTYSRDGRNLRIMRRESKSLETCFDTLLPLNTRTSRWVFIETKSNWCAYIENFWRGTDPTPIAPLAGLRLKCRGIRCTNSPYGSSPAVIFEVYKSSWSNDGGNTERAVWAMKDGGGWEFDCIGEPYGFEQVERYSAKRKRDRFTSEMLEQYLKEFGISPFNASFYLNPKCVFYYIDIDGPALPNQRECTLEQAAEFDAT